MYHQHFGLNEPPFSIAVNPRYLFMSPRHRDALAHLLYGVSSGGGFILLTGEVGTGKTTVNRCLLEQLPDTTDVAIILNPALSAIELLATACDELKIPYPAQGATLKQLTDALHDFLLRNHEAGRKTVLMIDEAQHLDFDVLEQIRLLTNLETHEEKLLQIILIGQPELSDKLSRPELRQLNQRITARYQLEPLNVEETGAYIRHRLEVAGLSQDQALFPSAVVRDIHRRTRGIPRLINLLCDRALLGAYGQRRHGVSKSLVKDAASEVLGTSERRTIEWRRALLWTTLLTAVLLIAAALWQQRGVATPVDAGAAANPARETSSLPGTASLPPWLLPEAEVAAALWILLSDAPPADSSCPAAVVAGLLCERIDAGTWQPVAKLERPVWLTMRRPDRFAAATLLVGIDGAFADVWTHAGIQRMPLAELASLWTGEARYFWRVPEGWQQPLARGDRSPAVATVAALFAELDGQPSPLTDSLFNASLEARVKLFQRREGLKDDGVVGAQTLQMLNRRAGIALDSVHARQRLGLLNQEG